MYLFVYKCDMKCITNSVDVHVENGVCMSWLHETMVSLVGLINVSICKQYTHDKYGSLYLIM